MPTIRRTAENLIVTRGGLPSCSCCDDITCDPDVTTIYAEITLNPLSDSPEVIYLTMTGSLNSGGSFSGGGGSLNWNGEKWVLSYSGIDSTEGVFTRCDLQGYYYGENDTDTFDATISFTPLP